MESPISKATMQAAVLSALSNVLGQCLCCYQAGRPLSLNSTEIMHFVLFSIMSCPPNFLWQSWLEATFPGYTEKASAKQEKSIAMVNDPDLSTTVVSNGIAHKGQEKNLSNTSADTSSVPGKTLNYRNTGIKFALDQTLGAAANTVMFIVGIALLRGEDMESIMHKLPNEFFPLLSAGQKFWPLISIISFTVIPVESRTVFGSAVGVIWGIVLTLMNGGRK